MREFIMGPVQRRTIWKYFASPMRDAFLLQMLHPFGYLQCESVQFCGMQYPFGILHRVFREHDGAGDECIALQRRPGHIRKEIRIQQRPTVRS